MTEIHGEARPGFEAVRDTFGQNFDEGNEVGAAFTLYHRGEKVVDLWGGVADEQTGAPWQEDTLQLVFSTTKGATAVCAHLLAQRGELDFDEPVATYWPEFAAAGKGDIPVRWLLCHTAGRPYVDSSLTLDEVVALDPGVEALAAQTPIWEPGEGYG
jgi:CubicO group peptidase (beta-lactamase class C family)